MWIKAKLQRCSTGCYVLTKPSGWSFHWQSAVRQTIPAVDGTCSWLGTHTHVHMQTDTQKQIHTNEHKTFTWNE